MSKLDRVKEEIGLLKLFLAGLIAIDVSLIAWLARNYARANSFLVLAGVATTLITTAASVWINSDAGILDNECTRILIEAEVVRLAASRVEKSPTANVNSAWNCSIF